MARLSSLTLTATRFWQALKEPVDPSSQPNSKLSLACYLTKSRLSLELPSTPLSTIWKMEAALPPKSTVKLTMTASRTSVCPSQNSISSGPQVYSLTYRLSPSEPTTSTSSRSRRFPTDSGRDKLSLGLSNAKLKEWLERRPTRSSAVPWLMSMTTKATDTLLTATGLTYSEFWSSLPSLESLVVV